MNKKWFYGFVIGLLLLNAFHLGIIEKKINKLTIELGYTKGEL